MIRMMMKIRFLSLLLGSLLALSSQRAAAQQYWQCSYPQDLSLGPGSPSFTTGRPLDGFCWNGSDDQGGTHITFYNSPTNNGLASKIPYDYPYVDGGDSTAASVDQTQYYGGGYTRIKWKKTGKHRITQRYNLAGFISFLDQDVWVTDAMLRSSAFTLTGAPNCPTASPLVYYQSYQYTKYCKAVLC